jgi:chaperonin GroEL
MSQQVARKLEGARRRPSSGPGILHGPAVRGALVRGIETMVATVRPTLGPLPRTVAVLEIDSGRPIEVLDDAATILRRTIELPDPYVNMGAMMLRHAVWKTYEAVGDGGAITAVLLLAIIRRLSPYVAAGGDPIALRRHLDRALAVATEALQQQSRSLQGPDEIAAAALTICQDPELAKMLGEILDIIGNDGCLLIENAYGSGLARQYVEGVHWNEGYRSPYFVTDEDKQEVRLDNPAILISDLRLTEADDLVPLLDRLVAAQCPGLLVIADEVSGSALSLLLANHRQGALRSVAVRAPIHVSASVLEDLAVVCGGRVVTAAGGERVADLALTDLGHATHVWANAGNFGIYGGHADPSHLRRRIAAVRAELAQADKTDEREQVRQRLGKLMGGVAVLHVGGDSEREQGARKALAMRTVTALRLALECGVAPGGGAAYLACLRALRAPTSSMEERVAFQGLAAALEEPLAAIAANAGFEPSTIAAQVSEHGAWSGFDALTGQVVDMWETGIVDPVPVLRKALEVAVSGAVMTLISGVLVHKREPLAVAKP